MDINELYDKTNEFREKQNLPPLKKEEFLTIISVKQINGHIQIENGEVKPAKKRAKNEN